MCIRDRPFYLQNNYISEQRKHYGRKSQWRSEIFLYPAYAGLLSYIEIRRSIYMSKLSVLIIEDEENICNFIKTSLRPQGYKIMTASTAAEGLSIVNSGGCDLVLLDLGLPDADGLEIIRQVRAWSSLPIIVISARTKEQEKVHALDAGADDYITKPFGTAELMARIRAALRLSLILI